MPEYLYEHPKTRKVVSVIQKMTDKHIYFKDGIEYKRVFVNPQTVLNSTSNIDAYSESDFAKKTENIKGGTLGNLFDISAELSQKREQKEGVDKVKNKAYSDYEKRTGKVHPFRKKTKLEVDFANKKIKEI